MEDEFDPKDYLEIKIPILINKNNNNNNDDSNKNKNIEFIFKTINEINEYHDILNNIKLTKDLDYAKKTFPLMYNIFQICKFFNIDYNSDNFIIRQPINMTTEGKHDFDLPKSGYFKGEECQCIRCKSKFIAIRNTIKVCNSDHYCKVIDILTGEVFDKKIEKWNKTYYEINKEDGKEYCYLEGKCPYCFGTSCPIRYCYKP